jgi:tetratricopeptide (TPR) repeat protein
MTWLDAARRHERLLAALWILGVVLLFGAMAVKPIRLRLLGGLQGAAVRYDARWERRLAEGQRLVIAGRFDEATAYLDRLDAEFPARTSRYGRDKEREYLLRLLAQSYEATGHTGKAMATWTRLVAFDSLNYRNFFGYAQAAERLLSGWAVAPEARDGFARALDLLPSHLPSLRGYVAYYNDRGEWREVAAAYRTYLDAFLLEQVTLRIGDSTRVVPVLIDGLAHNFDVAVPVPPGWSGDLVLSSSVYPMALEQVAVLPALTVGAPAVRTPREVSLAAMTASNMTRSGPGWVPTDSVAALHVPLQSGVTGLVRVTLRLRTFKLLDAPLWAMITKAYRNLLDAGGLADAQLRTATFASPAAADSAFSRLEWTRGGQFVPEAP